MDSSTKNKPTVEELLLSHKASHSSKQLLISKLPRLYNKNYHEMLSKSQQIAERFNIMSKAYKGYTTMNAFIFPYHADIDRLVDMTGVMNWAFYADDLLDRWSEHSDMIQLACKCFSDAWHHGTADGFVDIPDVFGEENLKKLQNACELACYLRGKLLQNMPKENYLSYIQDLYEWYHLDLHVNNDDDVEYNVNSSDDYLKIKEKQCGMKYTSRPTVQYLNNWFFDIDANLTRCGYVEFVKLLREYERYNNLLAGLSNDLFSFPKEAIGCEIVNYLKYKIIENDYDLNKSVNDLIHDTNDMYKKSQSLFCQLLREADKIDANDVSAFDKKNLKKYIIDLSNMVPGFYYFQFESMRYSHPNHIFVDKIVESRNPKLDLG